MTDDPPPRKGPTAVNARSPLVIIVLLLVFTLGGMTVNIVYTNRAAQQAIEQAEVARKASDRKFCETFGILTAWTENVRPAPTTQFGVQLQAAFRTLYRNLGCDASLLPAPPSFTPIPRPSPSTTQ